MNAIMYGNISKIITEISTDITNSIGIHNTFIVVTNSQNHYPKKKDPIILRYDANVKEWIYVADSYILDFGYAKETIDVRQNSIKLTKKTLDNIIWDIFIVDEFNNIVESIPIENLVVENDMVYGLDKYIGNTISLMYSFGEHSEDSVIPKVDIPTIGTYYNEVIDTMAYDGPYDMNDILTTIEYPNGNSYFDKIILDRIKEITNAVELINSRKLYTTIRIPINDNKIKLPFKPIGTVVHNYARIYDTNDTYDNVVTMEVTCGVVNDYVIFDADDNLNNKYAVVTYLAEILSPIL